MHDIAQKQIFFKKLPELDPDPDLVVKFPDPAKRSGSDRIRIRTTTSTLFKPTRAFLLQSRKKRLSGTYTSQIGAKVGEGCEDKSRKRGT
jgi:hypothetical protein